MGSKNFLHSLHWFRGIAIIFVVMGHAVVKLRTEDTLSIYLISFFQNGTFFFIFIAGYLFWHLKDRYEYKSYLINKLNNVVSPYVFLLAIVLVMAFYLQQKGIQLGNNSYEVSFTNPFEVYSGFLWHYFVGGSIIVPFWFLPFIFIVFLTSIIIFNISKSKYFIPFFIVFFLLALFTPRAKLDTSPIIFPFFMYIHFVGVFIFGILMKKYEKFFYNNAKILTLVFLGLFILSQIIFIMTRVNGFEVIPYLNMGQVKMTFGVIFFLSLLFFIEKNIDTHNSSNILIKLLNILAKYSFAIFFLHTFALKAFEIILNKYSNGVDNILGFTILIIGTFFVSIIISWIAQKIFGKKSRMLIGS